MWERSRQYILYRDQGAYNPDTGVYTRNYQRVGIITGNFRQIKGWELNLLSDGMKLAKARYYFLTREILKIGGAIDPARGTASQPDLIVWGETYDESDPDDLFYAKVIGLGGDIKDANVMTQSPVDIANPFQSYRYMLADVQPFNFEVINATAAT